MGEPVEFKEKLKRFVRPIGTGLLILQIVVFPVGITVATSGSTIPSSNDEYVSNRTANILKVCSVLENRIENQQLLEKTKDKVLTLSDGQTRLIASLSDRVAKGGNTTVGDIAFLLMAALITLL
jgi:hypothetical protein